MKILPVEKEYVPYTIRRLRELVDEYNSYDNRELTDTFFDEILIQYSEIQLHRWKHRNDPNLFIELEDNGNRYLLKKYSFHHKSGDK